MQGTNYINSAVNSNRQMYQNLSNQNPFANKTQYSSSNKTQYYNDEVAIKKQKKKETNKKIVSLFTGISVIALSATAIISLIKGKKSDLFHAIKSLMKDGKLETEGFNEETIKKAKSIYGKYESVFNLTTNFGTIRDDYADRLINKTQGTPFEFIKKGADKLKGLYNKWTFDGAIKSFAVAKENLPESVIKEEGIGKFADFFNEANIATQNLTKGKRITQELFKNPDGSKKGLKKVFEEVEDKCLADEKLKELYEKYRIDITKPQYKNLSKAEIESINKYNKVTRETIERLRDTNIGNPISDAAGILISAGGLGAAIATAEDKKEKKSITINLGIPILTTIASVVIGSAKSISGAKSMVFGAILGVFGSTAAKAIDHATKGKPADLNSLELKA